jgi:two-component system, NtrC family, sensor histidine kinase HydH
MTMTNRVRAMPAEGRSKIMPPGKWLLAAFILAFSLLVTFFHLWVFQNNPTHIVLEELYYVPILVGALFFALKGALIACGFVSVLYLPYLFGPWAIGFLGLADRLLHLMFTWGFAFLAGYLIDRDRRIRRQLEKDRYLTGLGQAAATIVHDLKNPLMSILGFARRLKAGKGDLGSGLQTIIDSASQMENIVTDVLNFAKPVQLKTKDEDLRGIVEQATAGCKARAEAAGISLSSELPAEPIIISVDGLRLQRALTNLITNAIEASPEGREVVLLLKTTQEKLVIMVKDQGVGMDRETLENVFIPFFSKKAQGTGLGMAIAKKVVEAHGGQIFIRSQPERGTEVRIEFPR